MLTPSLKLKTVAESQNMTEQHIEDGKNKALNRGRESFIPDSNTMWNSKFYWINVVWKQEEIHTLNL